MTRGTEVWLRRKVLGTQLCRSGQQAQRAGSSPCPSPRTVYLEALTWCSFRLSRQGGQPQGGLAHWPEGRTEERRPQLTRALTPTCLLWRTLLTSPGDGEEQQSADKLLGASPVTEPWL